MSFYNLTENAINYSEDALLKGKGHLQLNDSKQTACGGEFAEDVLANIPRLLHLDDPARHH